MKAKLIALALSLSILSLPIHAEPTSETPPLKSTSIKQM